MDCVFVAKGPLIHGPLLTFEPVLHQGGRRRRRRSRKERETCGDGENEGEIVGESWGIILE